MAQFHVLKNYSTLFIVQQQSKGCDNGNENPSVETTKDFDVGSKVQASSGHEMTSSQVNANIFIQAIHT
ncbi:hypothetical protein MTR_3g453010 [Medicago truncatula]|uniref:Uncharacterized protein n=1 Tax=Medicago truncatula TaxID=3880 RepID=A0A072UVE2_MEDTR|nr:hypothetical protein MTR_3g453010 [Medicago truncatula]